MQKRIEAQSAEARRRSEEEGKRVRCALAVIKKLSPEQLSEPELEKTPAFQKALATCMAQR